MGKTIYLESRMVGKTSYLESRMMGKTTYLESQMMGKTTHLAGVLRLLSNPSCYLPKIHKVYQITHRQATGTRNLHRLKKQKTLLSARPKGVRARPRPSSKR